MSGRGDGGLRGIGVSGSWYNQVLALEVRMWLIASNERDVWRFLRLDQLLTQKPAGSDLGTFLMIYDFLYENLNFLYENLDFLNENLNILYQNRRLKFE